MRLEQERRRISTLASIGANNNSLNTVAGSSSNSGGPSGSNTITVAGSSSNSGEPSGSNTISTNNAGITTIIISRGFINSSTGQPYAKNIVSPAIDMLTEKLLNLKSRLGDPKISHIV